MSEKKIYLALIPSDDFIMALNEWKKHWTHLPVRWMANEDLHITIIPPWYEANVARINKIVADFKSHYQEAIRLYFNYVSFGPSNKHPRLIWTEGVAPEKVISLKKELETAFGIADGGQSLRLHMTLARFDEKEFANFPVQDISQNVEWPCLVKDIVLKDS